MKADRAVAKDIDEYIARLPKETRAISQRVRAAIRKAAPDAEEKISYQIPAFFLEGNLVHFAAYRNHIGFYPGAAGIEKFKSELPSYETAKGTVRFSLDRPIPFDLITEIVELLVKDNMRRKQDKLNRPRKR